MSGIGNTTGQLVIDPELFRWMATEAFANKELVREFDRLRGTSLSARLSPIEIMVDETTGKMESDLLKFLDFVKWAIYEPLVGRYSFALEEK